MPQMTLTAEIQPEQMGQRLDQTLAELFPAYSRSRLKTWIEAKQVKMNGEIADIPRAKVYGGEQIEISVEVEDENRFEPQNIPLNIVYEDDDIIGYHFVIFGILMDFIKAGDDANTAFEKAKGQYGRVADAVKIIDPRKE